jgi:molybdate transport system substrate-binding protein
MRISVIRIIVLLLVVITSRAVQAEEVLVVAAAADLKFALEEIVGSNSAVKITYGSSGTLFAQIQNGAPFDVFLSADTALPKKLGTNVFLYAIGHLVVWVPTHSALDLGTRGINVLLDPAAKRIAIANPEHAPYGRAAVAALKQLGIYDSVAPKLVLGENVAQAAQFVQSGAAEAGIIALSLALAPKLKDMGRYWEVPADAYPRLEQGGIVLRPSAAATAFREKLTGPQGREILKRNGFMLPE